MVIGCERFSATPDTRSADILRDSPAVALQHGDEPRGLHVSSDAAICAPTGPSYAVEAHAIHCGFRLGSR